jgi:hypothetical protein
MVRVVAMRSLQPSSHAVFAAIEDYISNAFFATAANSDFLGMILAEASE